MSSTSQTLESRSPLQQLLIGFAASTALFVLWKVVDTPFLRVLERRVEPEMLGYLQFTFDWVVPAAALVPAAVLLIRFALGIGRDP